ncbi:MAG: NAD-dependent epimerase/dehydratase family protein [bacterium]|nr:NAD-dependent epimerase/dehydratase family protein [bacterium]
MKKVLITGVSGFIGPHVVEACLKKGWKVTGVDVRDRDPKYSPPCVFWKEDVRNLSLCGFDYIIHLAFVTNIPYSIEHPIETFEDNVVMTSKVLSSASHYGVKKLIFSSTASLYGRNQTPWREDMPSGADPIEPYSCQKLSCEHMCRMWTKCYDLPTTTLRLFQVFGENQRPDTAMAAFFRAKQSGKPITLTETTAQSTFKSGQRDFIYVKEVADAFVRACESEKTGGGEIINIGTGKVTTMEDVARAIGGEVTFIPKRGFEVERHEADITRAKELLDWHPKVDVLEWLREFVPTLERS